MEPMEDLDVISSMMIHSDDIESTWIQMENSIKTIMKGNCAKINIMLVESYVLNSLKYADDKFRFREISICNYILTLTERL